MVAPLETLMSFCPCQTLICLLNGHKSPVGQFLKILSQMGDLVRMIFLHCHPIGFLNLLHSGTGTDTKDEVGIVCGLALMGLIC